MQDPTKKRVRSKKGSVRFAAKRDRDESAAAGASAAAAAAKNPDAMDSDEDGEGSEEEVVVCGDEGDEQQPEEAAKRVWRPGVDEIAEDEELDFDPSAYTMFHKFQTDWPCLSFDIVRDSLGYFRTKYPASMYLVAGTQAERPEQNKIMALKITELHKTYKEDAEDDDASSSDEDEPDPIIAEAAVPHMGGVNRIRAMPQASNIVASWADTGHVHVWDLRPALNFLDNPVERVPPIAPLISFAGHNSEGFAMDWSTVTEGNLLTGDCQKAICSWSRTEAGFVPSQEPFVGHTASVEDLQWSPNEATVFASCSADQTIRIWDTRARGRSMAHVVGHKSDVNVISWNRKVFHLLVSGADDGGIKIWDLRTFRSDTPAAHFTWHSQPISSIEWHPSDETMLAASSADNTVTVWDMALEADPEAVAQGANIDDVELPPQLLFVHQGQQEIKELHFHPQLPSTIISTAVSGFNVFKTSNMQ